MAAPIAHVFLALQVLAGPLNGLFNEKEFLVGTSFPDIRYLKLIQRAQTHFDNVSFDDIKNEKNSFKAGMLFHSFVDQKREEFIEKMHIYGRLPQFRFITQALKFAEDQILRTLFDIERYRSYFDEILPEERSFNISDENIITWHQFLKEYFAKNLTVHDLTMRYFDLHQPDSWRITRWFFSWYYAAKISGVVNDICQNKQYSDIKELLQDFYLNFTKRYCS